MAWPGYTPTDTQQAKQSYLPVLATLDVVRISLYRCGCRRKLVLSRILLKDSLSTALEIHSEPMPYTVHPSDCHSQILSACFKGCSHLVLCYRASQLYLRDTAAMVS